jgi:hypothetical protein
MGKKCKKSHLKEFFPLQMVQYGWKKNPELDADFRSEGIFQRKCALKQR